MPARLSVEEGMATPASLDLPDGSEATLGRNRDCSVFLQDKHASRAHARLHHDGSAWRLTDLNTTNGTRVEGRLIDSAALCDGQVISVGAVRLRFRVVREAGAPVEEPYLAPADPLDGSDSTHFEADDLTALLRFTNAAQWEQTPQGLIVRALDAVLRQTGAALAGFLSLDADTPESRVVRPQAADVDPTLSRRLTQAVLRQGGLVWLAAGRGGLPEGDSLARYRDAVCVPLRGGANGGRAGDPPLGALHAYRTGLPFNERQVRFCELLAANLANALEVLRARRALEADNERLRTHAAALADEIIGASAAITRVREQVRRLADAPCSVLITGETGVGKELVALGLHRQSQRHRGPLVTVNCAAIAGGLAEAELFGTARGAYTGCPPEGRPGYFAQADMGTLFLDEVGELSLDMQAKLLRVLETRCFRPVGASADARADVRVIAASNRDLQAEVREGRFRRDLYFRLTATLHVPPLREHPEDIPELARHFLEGLSREYGRLVDLSPAATERLLAYAWPGNVRQLRSVLEGALALGERDVIQAGDLCLQDEGEGPLPEAPATLNLVRLEEWAIRQAMRRTGGNVLQAAKVLGLHRSTLHAKLKHYGIQREGDE